MSCDFFFLFYLFWVGKKLRDIELFEIWNFECPAGGTVFVDPLWEKKNEFFSLSGMIGVTVKILNGGVFIEIWNFRFFISSTFQ